MRPRVTLRTCLLPLVLLALGCATGPSRRVAPGTPAADPARLEADVRALASEERNTAHPEALARAAVYVEDQLRRTGARVDSQRFTVDGLEVRNVIARFGPESGPVLVVGAHYDSAQGTPGADDNASGAAGLLELARLLASRHLASPVELVAFVNEEPPYFRGPQMGSAVHAAGLAASGRRVRAMIALEMIGFFAEKQPSPNVLLTLFYPHRGDFVVLAGRGKDLGLVGVVERAFHRASRVRVVTYTGPRKAGSDLSDHRNYWAQGIHAVMVTDTAFIRNANYHEATDVPDTLDYARMAGVVDGVLAATVDLANRP